MNLSFLDKESFLNKANQSACLVIGDIILDKYIDGLVNRISPEAPIPVVRIAKERYVLGGAANVAGNIRGYHMKVYLSGLLGNDESGTEVMRLLSNRQIEFVGVVSNKRRTTIKTRVIGMGQQLLRIDEEDSEEVYDLEEKQLLVQIEAVLPEVQVVVLSDYNKGICSESFCKKLIQLCKDAGKKVVVDPKSSNWTKYMGASMVTPNFKEFQEVVGHSLNNTETDIAKYAVEVLEKYRLSQVLVTRSQYGMTLVQREGKLQTFQAVQQEVYDVSGAGDTVIATIAAFQATGYSVEHSLEAANYAAGLAVSKVGTYMVSLEEVVEYVNRSGVWYEEKVLSKEALKETLAMWNKMDETIVFTNGCFDILHIGHIDYLNRARLLGSKLIIGLNSDFSVKRLKGEGRPINNQNARALGLAALQCVDAVVLFDEDTPEELIKVIQPDFLVKGGDYRIEDIVGRQYAKEVRTIPFTEGYSTTKILEKIRCELVEA